MADDDADTVSDIGLQLGDEVGSGVRGKADADTEGVCLLLGVEAGDADSRLGDGSTSSFSFSFSELLLIESRLKSPSTTDGEFIAIALDKNSA